MTETAIGSLNSSSDITELQSLLSLIDKVTQNPLLNSNTTLSSALNVVDKSLSLLNSSSAFTTGTNLTSSLQNTAIILSNVVN